MEKSRFDIISDLFKLSNVISGSLKLAESLADKSSGSDETDCKDICRNIRYSLKPLPFLWPASGNMSPNTRIRIWHGNSSGCTMTRKGFMASAPNMRTWTRRLSVQGWLT